MEDNQTVPVLPTLPALQSLSDSHSPPPEILHQSALPGQLRDSEARLLTVSTQALPTMPAGTTKRKAKNLEDDIEIVSFNDSITSQQLTIAATETGRASGKKRARIVVEGTNSQVRDRSFGLFLATHAYRG